MNTRLIQKVILCALLLSGASQADVLNPGAYVFGAIGTERAEIIQHWPGAQAEQRLRCRDGACEKVVIGWRVRKNDALLASVTRHMAALAAKHKPTWSEASQAAGAGIAADGATTAAGLAAGATEMNPLLGSSPDPIALLAMGLLRHSMVQAVNEDTSLSAEQKAEALCTHAGLATGAAANNLAVLAVGAGAGLVPALIGAIVGHARHSHCMAQAQAAQAWLVAQENQALRDYAAQLSTPELQVTAASATKVDRL